MCLILYGSATGNATDLADNLFDDLRRRDIPNIECKPFGKATLTEVQKHRHVFIICSTAGQGSLPTNAQPFWSNLLKKSLKAPLFGGIQLYSFGLGSSSYPRYNWATRKIHSRFLQLGAKEAIPRGEGNDMGTEPYESIFDQWKSMALSNIDSDLQIINARPQNELLPPMFPVKLVSAFTPPPSPSQQNRETALLSAKVISNMRITDPEHFQDVRHLRLSVETAGYEPGDNICLYPANDDAVVNAILESQNWSRIAQHHVIVPKSYQADGQWQCPLTLETLLKWHVDLNAIPRRKFFLLAQHFCSNTQQVDRMQEFAADLDDLFNYTSRPRRSITEVITEFDSLQIPLEYILDLLPPMRSRQFSISSDPQNPDIVELSVSIVKYRTVLRKVRRGICTRYIEQLHQGDRLYVSIENNKMQIANKIVPGIRPIFVATGTGIAPIRSLLHSLPRSEMKPFLFFGCRYEDKDFLYKDELNELAEIVPAFSRQQGGYVQQSIVKYATKIDVCNALIFVCGSAGAMPQAVRAAFLESLEKQGHSSEAAERVIATKEKLGTYIQETW